MEARSSFLNQIISRQFEDTNLSNIRDKALQGETKEAVIDDEDFLRIKRHMYMPRVEDLAKIILIEAHNSRYSIHP